MNRSVHKDTCRIWDRGVCNCGPINAAPESRDAGGAAPSADSDGGAELPQVDANNSGLAMKLADGREVRARLSVDGGSVCFDLTATNAAHTKIALSFEAIESMRLLANRLAAAQECGDAVAPEAKPEWPKGAFFTDGEGNFYDEQAEPLDHAFAPPAPPAPPAPLPGKEYRTGFDEAPSTFNQEDAAPADYPPPSDAVSREQAIEHLDYLHEAYGIRADWEPLADIRRFIEQSGRSGVSADPLPLADEKLDSQVHDHTDTHIYATIEAACWGEYSVEASRESERDDWYMVVTAPNGIKDYDGTWRRSYDKGLDEVLQQAIDGAMLRAVPSPNLSAMVAAQQHQVKKGEPS
jgi:hypothetical protein